jgi:hypothetical protein
MLGSTHTRIALRLSEELGITEKRNLGLIASGSTAPDSWANFPHHHGKDGEIVTDILMARQQFLQDNDECFYRLGIALHYIADKWTLKPRIADKHTEWEIAIDKMPIVNDAELAKAIEETSIQALIHFSLIFTFCVFSCIICWNS